MMQELYRRAKARLRKQRKNHRSKAGVPKSATDSLRLLHELQVHQVELEMQNAELQDAQDRMEALLEKYTDLYDFAPVGYFTLAADGTIRLVNLSGAGLIGIERSRLVGRSFGLLVSEGLRPVFNSFLKQVFAGQTKQSGDFELLCQGQPPRIVNIEAQRLLNGQACRAAVVDITERKRAEDKVRVSEVRYRRLFEATHDGILLLDPGTRKITDANPFMTKLLGYPHAQLVGKELFEIGLLKDEVASQEMFQKLKRKHEVRYEDLPLESQGGRHQEVEVVANLYQENGHAVIQCNIRDITQRKLAENALRESGERFRFMAEAMPQKIFTAKPDGNIDYFNQQWIEFTGLTFEQIRDWGWLQFIHPDDQQENIRRWQHSIDTGEFFELEHRFRRKDGVYRWHVTRAHPLRDAGSKTLMWIGSNTDIDDLKRAEATQRRSEVLAASNRKLEQEIVRRQAVEESLKQSEQHQSRLLEQSRQMQEQLRQLSRQVLQAQEEERKRISRELHDVIAQTLTGINLRLATLKKEAGLNTEGFDRNIARTQLLVGKSVDIVHQFARELRPAVLDDLGLIPALHSFMKDFTTQTGVRTRLTAFAGVEQLDTARRTVFFRVAQEALTNVARHAQASRVEISIRKQPDCLCMKIKDDGKSFQVERVLHGKGSKRLGLLGMRERMEMVGGSFVIESAPGQGTTIQVEIPFAKVRKSPVKKSGKESTLECP